MAEETLTQSPSYRSRLNELVEAVIARAKAEELYALMDPTNELLSVVSMCRQELLDAKDALTEFVLGDGYVADDETGEREQRL